MRNSPWNEERKIQWLKDSGSKLSGDQKIMIEEFSEIFSKINFNLIQAYFLLFNGEKLTDVLVEELGRSGYNKLKNI